MERSARMVLQLQAALSSVSVAVPDLSMEIAGTGRGSYLRLVGEVLPTMLEQIQRHRGELTAAIAEDNVERTKQLAHFTATSRDTVQLGFYPWVPFMPPRLRARLTAQSAVEFVVEFLDARLGIDGWSGGGADVHTRINGDQIEVTLVNPATKQSIFLPSMPVAPFRRNLSAGR